MNDGGLARIKYYKGQLLTAGDFNDQQEYHREKQKHLLRRFPYGIIGGLKVKCQKKDDSDPNDVDTFVIGEGLAVDQNGDEIVVTEKGVRMPVAEFNTEKPYLNLLYDEQDDFVGNGLCGGDQKNNRIREGAKAAWSAAPNIAPAITVAKIKLKDEEKADPNCDNYEIVTEENDGGPRIRINARVVDTEQIAKGAITPEKIQSNAVTEDKIKEGAVTKEKIGADAVTAEKIVVGAVDESKLNKDIKDKLVTRGDGHDHSGTSATPIPEEGLQKSVKDKLVPKGKEHDHTGDAGALIPEPGLHEEVRKKLVTDGDKHNHTAGHGYPIPEAGLEEAVQKKLVKGGSDHRHTGDDGSRIDSNGLEKGAVTKEKLNLIATDKKEGTLSDPEKVIPFSGVPRNAIIQVIPTAGSLSWSCVVEYEAAGTLKYMVKIKNESGAEIGYLIRAIEFN